MIQPKEEKEGGRNESRRWAQHEMSSVRAKVSCCADKRPRISG